MGDILHTPAEEADPRPATPLRGTAASLADTVTSRPTLHRSTTGPRI